MPERPKGSGLGPDGFSPSWVRIPPPAYGDTMIIPSSTSLNLSISLSRLLGEKVVIPERKVFPDGELYVRIPEKPKMDERIIVVGSTHQPDRNWVELLLLLDASMRLSEETILIVPYYGYSRQDKVFRDGEPVSAEVFCRSIPVDSFITVAPHFLRAEGKYKFCGKHVHVVSAIPSISSFIKNSRIDTLVDPDRGAEPFVSEVAERVGANYTVFEKYRDRETGSIEVEGEPVKGKRVAVVDDIIASGSTMLKAAEYITAETLYFIGIHGVFSSGWERLKVRGEVIVTNTIERPESKIDVSEDIFRAINIINK